ncbi:hypothetical protein D9M68_819790 [compost metagenome]
MSENDVSYPPSSGLGDLKMEKPMPLNLRPIAPIRSIVFLELAAVQVCTPCSELMLIPTVSKGSRGSTEGSNTVVGIIPQLLSPLNVILVKLVL